MNDVSSGARPCFCVPEVEKTCGSSADCPSDQTCTADIPRPWLRDVCLNDPNDPR